MANVWINEFHYDNSGTDAGEFIEIAGVAGTDLTGWSIVLYNGSGGASYGTLSLSGTIPDTTGTGFGFLSLAAAGLQNGSPDGVALVNNAGQVIEFISYEGSFAATNGPASGLTSTDVGVSEPGAALGTSIARTGTGDDSADFTWGVDSDDTPGAVNNGQTFTGTGETFSIAATDAVKPEGNAGTTTFTFTVTRANPTAPATVDWALSGVGGVGQADAADFSGATSGTLTFDGVETTKLITLTVAGDTVTEMDETFSVTLSNPSSGTGIAAATANGTIQNDEIPLSLISTIQGSGTTSALNGQTVTVEAIVVGDFQNGDADAKRNLNGFYLQEENADQDGNALTSEGLFVFLGSLAGVPDVNVGDRVFVTGTVNEFSGSTQLNATAVSLVQANAVADVQATMAVSVDLPAAEVIQRPGTVANSTTSFYPNLEAYEGMLVNFTDTMTITEQFALDQFVEVRLAAGAVPETSTQENQPDAAGFLANLQEIASRTIVYDDGLNVQNTPIGNLDEFGPTYNTANALRMGDTIDGLTGVLDFAFNQFRLRSVEDGDNVFTEANPRPAAPADVGGTLTIGSFNVLNYFTTLGTNITASGLAARGATNAIEFALQTEKLVNVITELGADVLALIELENNFLPGAAGNAIEFLVNSLNTVLGAGTYSWVNPGQQLVGGDAIAVGFIYKPSSVTVSVNTTIETLDDSDLAGLGLSDLLAQSSIGAIFNGVNTSRVPLAVSFTEIETGGEFTVVANHLKSKSGTGTGADADQLDGQGNWQQQRELAAEAIKQWIATDPTGSGDVDVLLLGDFNAYLKEDVLDDILQPAGFTNLAASLPPGDAYSYIFDGQRGSLDHILANATAAAQVTGVAEWHINADEADALDYNLDFGRDPAIFDANALARVSDHDPLLIGLDLVEEAPFVMQLLHFYGETGTIAKDTAPIMGAMIDKFDDQYSNTLILAEGDTWIPGPWLVAGADPALNAVPGIGATATARPDIAILNAFGTDASALGNHEFDLGSPVVSGAIAPAGAWVGAQFPFITANLNFAADSSLRGLADASLGGTATNNFAGQEAATIKGKIAPSTVVTMNGEKVGIVGATTYDLLIKTSPNGTVPKDDGTPTTDDLQEVAAYIQAAVDQLRAQGINKIIMVDQLDTIERNEILAPMLNGIDVMVAGGGHERLGDANDTAVAFNGHDASFVGDYPILTSGMDGAPTLIVTTDTEFTYLGRLVVSFDGNGEIILSSLDPVINGAYATNEAVLQSIYGTTDTAEQIIDQSVIGSKVEAIADAIDAIVTAKDGNKFGFSSVYLEGDRVFARSQETNLGDITADANAFMARATLPEQPFMVSLKNGGGIRSSVGSIDEEGAKIANLIEPGADGNVSQLDVENALRFDNKLMVFDTTPQGLLNILNFGANLATLGAAGTQQGGFPQIGGVKFSFDPDNAAGLRVVNVGLINEQGELIAKVVENGVILADAPALISVVALNFTANGGDGYPIKSMTDAAGNFLATNFRYLLNDGTLSAPVPFDAPGTNRSLVNLTVAPNVPANALGEQKAFEDYLEDRFGTPEQAYDVADTPASGDLRIENLNVRSDAVFDNLAPEIAGDFAITLAEGGEVVITTADLNEADPDNSGFVLNYTVTATSNGKVLLNGVETTTFNQLDLDAGNVRFKHNGSETTSGSFTVTLKDAGGLTSGTATVQAIVTPHNDAPVITSAASFTVAENLTSVGTIIAADMENDAFAFALAGGPDQAFFSINANTGALSFLNSPDFETKEDADHDNTYSVMVSATDLSGASSTQAIGISISDVVEPGSTITSGNGNDAVAGTSGNDTINSANGNDTVTGGDGNDTIFGGSGNDLLTGGRGDDFIDGGNGNDSLAGGGGDNLLIGGNGNDIFNVGSGNNLLTGGNGNDSFQFGPDFGSNIITDFGNGDRIAFDDVFFDFEAVLAASNQLDLDTVIGLNADHSITLQGVVIGSLDASDFLFV